MNEPHEVILVVHMSDEKTARLFRDMTMMNCAIPFTKERLADLARVDADTPVEAIMAALHQQGYKVDGYSPVDGHAKWSPFSRASASFPAEGNSHTPGLTHSTGH